MAAENYIRDISTYLTTGKLSDLTLNLGEKSWKIHKALACCHSKWFQKALTGDFNEGASGEVTLEDDLDFADALDCMVSYFYKAGYDASKYDVPECFLHAQVVSIADKYDCASLYELAILSFVNTIKVVTNDDWVAIAGLIYDHTIPDSPAHAELRNIVVAAVVDRPAVLKAILQMDSVVELLRSNADLATDLLLSGLPMLKTEDNSRQIFVCDYCRYTHAGSGDCSSVVFNTNYTTERTCPQCRNISGATNKRYMQKINLLSAFPCPYCDGIHTLKPEPDAPPSSLVANSGPTDFDLL